MSPPDVPLAIWQVIAAFIVPRKMLDWVYDRLDGTVINDCVHPDADKLHMVRPDYLELKYVEQDLAVIRFCCFDGIGSLIWSEAFGDRISSFHTCLDFVLVNTSIIDPYRIAENPAAMPLIRAGLVRFSKHHLLSNCEAMDFVRDALPRILEKKTNTANRHKTPAEWRIIATNSNPKAIRILVENVSVEDMCWYSLSTNSGARNLIVENFERVVGYKFAVNPLFFELEHDFEFNLNCISSFKNPHPRALEIIRESDMNVAHFLYEGNKAIYISDKKAIAKVAAELSLIWRAINQ